MPLAKADLILHPIRMRILAALAGRQQTAQQLARVLHDVPQATLYRHINLLAQHDILTIVEARQVRGTVEKVYSLDTDAARLGKEDARDVSNDDHLRYFTAFVISLLGDFSRYIEQQENFDFVADCITYNKGVLHLSDAELQQVQEEVRAVLLPRLNNTPSPERRARIFALMLLPSTDVQRDGSNA